MSNVSFLLGSEEVMCGIGRTDSSPAYIEASTFVYGGMAIDHLPN
jgi:hypothetical protein